MNQVPGGFGDIGGSMPGALSSGAFNRLDRCVVAGKENGVLAIEQGNKAIVKDADAADALSNSSKCLDFVASVIDSDHLIGRVTDWRVAGEVGNPQNIDHTSERISTGDCGEGRSFGIEEGSDSTAAICLDDIGSNAYVICSNPYKQRSRSAHPGFNGIDNGVIGHHAARAKGKVWNRFSSDECGSVHRRRPIPCGLGFKNFPTRSGQLAIDGIRCGELLNHRINRCLLGASGDTDHFAPKALKP